MGDVPREPGAPPFRGGDGGCDALPDRRGRARDVDRVRPLRAGLAPFLRAADAADGRRSLLRARAPDGRDHGRRPHRDPGGLAREERAAALGAEAGLPGRRDGRRAGDPGRPDRDLPAAHGGFRGARVPRPDVFLRRGHARGRHVASLASADAGRPLAGRLTAGGARGRGRVRAARHRGRHATHEGGPRDPRLPARARAGRPADRLVPGRHRVRAPRLGAGRRGARVRGRRRGLPLRPSAERALPRDPRAGRRSRSERSRFSPGRASRSRPRTSPRARFFWGRRSLSLCAPSRRVRREQPADVFVNNAQALAWK